MAPLDRLCVKQPWDTDAGWGGCTEGLMEEEGVSPGQQEACLFSSAPLEFKSAPAELTASSRFATAGWWIFLHPLLKLALSPLDCHHLSLYLPESSSFLQHYPPKGNNFMAEPPASSQLLSEPLSFDTRQLAAAAELQNPPSREARTATDRTELISSMSCSALALLEFVWNPSQGVCPGSTERLAGQATVPWMLLPVPAEVAGQWCSALGNTHGRVTTSLVTTQVRFCHPYLCV